MTMLLCRQYWGSWNISAWMIMLLCRRRKSACRDRHWRFERNEYGSCPFQTEPDANTGPRHYIHSLHILQPTDYFFFRGALHKSLIYFVPKFNRFPVALAMLFTQHTGKVIFFTIKQGPIRSILRLLWLIFTTAERTPPQN